MHRWKWAFAIALCLFALPALAGDQLDTREVMTAERLGALWSEARAGDTASMRMLGEVYLFGVGVEIDPGVALGWLRSAAAGGDARAQLIRARALRDGIVEAQDVQAALRLLERGALSATDKAIRGEMHFDRALILHELGQAEKAQRALDAAARDGHIVAQVLKQPGLDHGRITLARDAIDLHRAHRAGAFGAASVPGAADSIETVLAGVYEEHAARIAAAAYTGLGIELDRDIAFRGFDRAAGLGSANARTMAGVVRWLGVGTERDRDAAAREWAAGLREGVVGSRTFYAEAMIRGEGVEREPLDGVAELERIAGTGVPTAWYTLGWLYADGSSVVAHPGKAIDAYTRSADMGYAPAMYDLGQSYYVGMGVEMDVPRGVAYLRGAFDAGYALASYDLALLHRSGEIPGVSAREAAPWYEENYRRVPGDGTRYELAELWLNSTELADRARALPYLREGVDAGHVPAGRLLAKALSGEVQGVPADTPAALDVHRWLADQGEGASMYVLGNYAFVNAGDDAARREAIGWYERGGAVGHVECMYSAAMVLQMVASTDDERLRCAGWMRRAAGGGHATAMGKYGSMLLEGTFVPKDAKMGIVWLEEGAKKEDAFSLFTLATELLTGENVQGDWNRAAELYYRAKAAGSPAAAMAVRELESSLPDTARAARERLGLE